jgi:uncharacterized membrane protein
MDPITIARALHVLAIVHWIGGVAMVTLVLLPGIMRHVSADKRLVLFEMIEDRFAFQARISTLVAGLTGFYMTYELGAWYRFTEPGFWWMHAMLAVWAIFTLVLYVAEPLFLRRWFHERASRDPEGTFRLVQRMHVLLLTVSLVTVGASVLGAHGASLVAAKVVQDHDVAGPENLIDTGLESVAVDRPVGGHRRKHLGQAEPGDKCRRAPMAIRDVGIQPASSLSTITLIEPS